MYRLMFSDLDETLLVNHHVPKMNQEAILKAKDFKPVKYETSPKGENKIIKIIEEFIDNI